MKEMLRYHRISGRDITGVMVVMLAGPISQQHLNKIISVKSRNLGRFLAQIDITFKMYA